MTSERAIILGTQLKKARETVQFLPAEVAQRLRLDAQRILDWEAERAQPSLKELEALAALYGREIDYFLRETPSLPAEIQFRSATKHKFIDLSEEARKMIARFDELCRTAYEIESALGKVQGAEMRHVPESKSPVELAMEERETFGLGVKPVGKLRDALSERGIRIFELVVPEAQFSGFSWRHPDYGACILVNAKEVTGRRNFTLLHEYAHLLYGHQASVCDIGEERGTASTQEERRANLFAVEFLLPAQQVEEDFLRRGLSKTPTVQEVGRMAGKWGASVQCMFYRLEELGLFRAGYSDMILASFVPQAIRPRPPKVPSWQRRLGTAYVSNALEAYRQGYISLGKLAHSLGVSLRKVFEIVKP